MEENKGLIVAFNQEITRELKDPAVGRALLATTFKGLTDTSMRQAILEGMIRGFKFKNFLSRDVYAIPYGSGYSLVTSIDYARKVGAGGGVNGKSKPVFTYKENGEVESCDVTVFKKDGHADGYTASVYFDEYTTGKNLWKTKPRTMISKVSEMHALRMACPEELSKVYAEEEFQKEQDSQPVHYEVKRKQEPYEQEEKPNMLLHQNKRQQLNEEEIIDLEKETNG